MNHISTLIFMMDQTPASGMGEKLPQKLGNTLKQSGRSSQMCRLAIQSLWPAQRPHKRIWTGWIYFGTSMDITWLFCIWILIGVDPIGPMMSLQLRNMVTRPMCRSALSTQGIHSTTQTRLGSLPQGNG